MFAYGTAGIGAAWSLSTRLPMLVSGVTTPAKRCRVPGYVRLFWNLGMILSSPTGGYLFQARMGLPLLAGEAASAGAIGFLMALLRQAKKHA